MKVKNDNLRKSMIINESEYPYFISAINNIPINNL